jgi:hypothetical protein
MRYNARGERFMDAILYLKLPAGFLDDPGNWGIVDVADPREQVMLDLEVQPPSQPGNHSVISGEIHCRFERSSTRRSASAQGAWAISSQRLSPRRALA